MCAFIFCFQVKLDSFLEMPDVLLLPQVNLLQSNAHRSTVQKRSFNVIIAIYKQIYGELVQYLYFVRLFVCLIDGRMSISLVLAHFLFSKYLGLADEFVSFFFSLHFQQLQNEFTIQQVIWKRNVVY